MEQGLINRAVIYVTDKGFTVPSLVSAAMLRETTKSPAYDVLFYLIDFDEGDFEKIQCTFPEIYFFPLSSSELQMSSTTYFHKAHVPVATLGRLVLSPYIPEQYDHITYIDGDTQILENVSGLIEMDVPEGKIATVAGSMWMPDNGDWKEEYLQNLGGVDPYEYFNAGVLAFSALTWKTKGPEALDFFLKNSDKCRHHDQSALNAVFKGQRVALEPCYNFNTVFARLRVGYSPKIVHFTGPIKPWVYPVFPWGRQHT